MPTRGGSAGHRPPSTTGIEEVVAAGRAGSRFLLVTVHGSMRVHPLPDDGQITLGRDRACDIVLDHPSVSRRHARLHLGATCTVTDLGSRNGVLFRGERLGEGDEREVRPGESFAIGPCSMLLIPQGVPKGALTTVASRMRVDDPTGAEPSQFLLAIAANPVNMVIYGETGAGKEVLAATIHRLSRRAGPFIGINCATLGEALLESELFGHERGAFTGAVQSKPGLLQAAAGGTVLLDEIGDLSPAIQAKLLRAIETREILRVGGVRPMSIDVRFLAATNRDLLAMSVTDSFRKDLYFRLAGFVLEVPPLRERKGQIAGLAAAILAQSAVRGGGAPPAITAAASAALVAHTWPGNVRELRNVLERARVLCAGGDIAPEHLVFDRTSASTSTTTTAVDDERSRIMAALEACAGNQTHAARMLGMGRTTLIQRLMEHGIPRPRKRR
jgi:two-component system, NtrC family, response regulator AtoC